MGSLYVSNDNQILNGCWTLLNNFLEEFVSDASMEGNLVLGASAVRLMMLEVYLSVAIWEFSV